METGNKFFSVHDFSAEKRKKTRKIVNAGIGIVSFQFRVSKTGTELESDQTFFLMYSRFDEPLFT